MVYTDKDNGDRKFLVGNNASGKTVEQYFLKNKQKNHVDLELYTQKKYLSKQGEVAELRIYKDSWTEANSLTD